MEKSGHKHNTKHNNKHKIVSEHPWVNDLAGKTVNDDKWSCYCAIIEEAKPFYRIFTSEFENICHYGYRKYVHCISMSNIIETVWVNRAREGTPTPLTLLCDEVKKHAGKHFQGKIPPDLLAAVLKYIILGLKERDIKRKEQSMLLRSDYLNKLESYKSNLVPRKPKTTQSKVKTHTVQNEKISSKLHKRGEEMKSLVSIKDSPSNGPDVYIFLINFHDVVLPLELFSIGIPLTAIIQLGHSEQIKKGDTNTFRKNAVTCAEKNKEIKKILSETMLGPELYKESMLMFPDIRQYWTEFYYFYKNIKYHNYFKDLALIEFIPTLLRKPKSSRFVENLRIDMYNGLVGIMYNLVCIKNMYTLYKQKTNLINVADRERGDLKNLNFYNKLLNSFPQDTVTVGLIVDTLVAQVCRDKNDDIDYDIGKYSFLVSVDELKANSINCFDEKFKQLDIENDVSKTDEEDMKEKMLLETKDLEKPPIIRVIKEDDITLSSIYLSEEQRNFIKQRSNYMAQLFWNQRFWEKVTNVYETFPPGFFKTYTDRMANYVRATYGEDIITTFSSLSEIMRSFTPAPEDVIDPVYFIQEQIINENDSDAMSYVEKIIKEFMFCNNEKFVNLLNSHDVLRIMDGDVLLQKLHKDFMSSSCTKFEYFPLLGKILCKFFDAAVPRKTVVMVPSKITLGDFLEGLYFNKIIEMDILEKELKQCNSNFNKDELNFFDELRDQELTFPLIINDKTLTYQDCIPQQPEYEELIEELMLKENHKAEQTKNILLNDLSEEKVKFEESFIYDIGIPWKTEYTFSDIDLSFNNGLLMKLKYEGMVRENLHLSLTSKFRDVHNIHYHTYVFSSANKEDFHNIDSTLTVEHSSGMILSFRNFPRIKKVQSRTNSMRASINEETLGENHFESFDSTPFANFNPIFDLNISWPSGLYIDLITLEGLPPYIKQNYFTPHDCPSSEIKDELFRCILHNGIVIKFKNDDSVVLLYPNGKIVYGYEFRWTGDLHKIESPRENKLNDLGNLSLEMINYKIRFPEGKIYINDIGKYYIEKCICVESVDTLKCTYTVECEGDILVFQEDGVLKVNYKDGTVITSQAKFRPTPIFLQEYNEISGFETEEEKYNENLGETEMVNHEENVWLKEGNKRYHDGFEVVDLVYYKIENSHFATTIFDLNNEEIIYELPFDVKVKYYDSENIVINLTNDVTIHTAEDKIIAEEHFNEKLRNKIIFSMDNFENDEENHQTQCVTYSDGFENSVTIDVTGEIKVAKLNNITNNRATLNEVYFILDENYNGIKFISTNEMKQTLDQVKSDMNSLIHKNLNDTFMEYLTVTRLNVGEKWVIDLKAEVCNQNNDISTYGPSWSHPFKMKECDDNVFSTIRGVMLQLFKKVNFGALPSREFVDILNKFYFDFQNNPILLHGISGVEKDSIPLDELLVRDRNSFEIILQKIFDEYNSTCKTTKLKDWTEKNATVPPVLYAVYYARLKRVAKKYFTLKNKILNKQIPPYFESSDGNSFLLTDRIINDALFKSCRKMNANKLDALLNMNLNCVTSNDLEEIRTLLRQDDRGLWDDKCSKYSLEEVLEAGSELNQYFKNMKSVLEFHKNNLSSLNFSNESNV